MKRLLAVLLFAAAMPARAEAPAWTVDMAKSRLSYTITWSGEPLAVTFRHWTADIAFDPNDLAHAHAAVTIDLTSGASEESAFDKAVIGAEGFDAVHHPTARFGARTFRAGATKDRYEASGTLDLHGVTRPVTLPFTLAFDGKTAHMQGAVTLSRVDFALGAGGMWKSENPVSYRVAVNVDLWALKK